MILTCCVGAGGRWPRVVSFSFCGNALNVKIIKSESGFVMAFIIDFVLDVCFGCSSSFVSKSSSITRMTC
jgi:hypothetical protein